MDRDISSPGSAYSSNEVLSACNSNESVRKAPLKSILSKPKTDTADNIAPCNTLIVPSLSFDLKEKKRVSLCHSAGDVEEFRLRNAQISSSPSVKRSSEDLSFPSEDLNHRKVGRPDSLQSVLVNFDKKGDSGSPGIILTPNTLSVNL